MPDMRDLHAGSFPNHERATEGMLTRVLLGSGYGIDYIDNYEYTHQ